MNLFLGDANSPYAVGGFRQIYELIKLVIQKLNNTRSVCTNLPRQFCLFSTKTRFRRYIRAFSGKFLFSTHDFPQFFAVLKFANVNYMIISVFTTSTLHRDGFSFGSELWKRNDPQVAKMKRQKSAAECEAYTVLYGPSHVNPRL